MKLGKWLNRKVKSSFREESNRLATLARIASTNSRTIQNALDEIDNAEGM